MHELLNMLDKRLATTGEELVGYLQGHVKGKSKAEDEDREGKAENKVSRAVGEAYFTVLVPFMRRALVEGVYGVEIGKLRETQDETDGDKEEALRKVIREWSDVCNA